MDAALDLYNSEVAAKGLRAFVDRTGVQVISVSHRKELPLLAERVFRVGKGERLFSNSSKIKEVEHA